MDAEDALKKKYAQLRAKKKAEQQQQGGNVAGGGGSSATGSISGLSGILQQMESSSGLGKSQDNSKQDDTGTNSIVKASALDPSIIEAVKAKRGPTGGGEPPAKRAKLPTMTKRISTDESKGSAGGRDYSEHDNFNASATDNPPTLGASGGSKNSSYGDKVEGLPRRVHEALQRIFTEGSLRRDEMEDKVLTALRALPESDALRALDQFGNEDMSRIRNKAAYLWGIVRNLKDGRSVPPGRFGGAGNPLHDSSDVASPSNIGNIKLLWPEEEKVMQELGAPEGRRIEREFTFDTSACNLPPAESLYTDEPYQNSELTRVRSELAQAKSDTEGHDPLQWLKLTSQVSLTGRVVPIIRQTCRPELLSTSWVQFYELFSSYPLICPASKADEKMRSLHLCEMSGASVAALNHFLKTRHPNMNIEWVAHTRLPPPVPQQQGAARSLQVGAKSEEERFMRETREQWVFSGREGGHNERDASSALQHTAAYDASSLSSLPVDAAAIKAIRDMVRENKAAFDVVIADSGVMSDAHMHAGAATAATSASSTPRDAARDIPEATAARVFLSQVVLGLSVLAPKGGLVLRMWALWAHQNAGLLFLLSCVFSDVKVCRPSTVQLAGEDTFVVCCGFKGLGQAHLEALDAEVARSSANTNTMISKSNLPSEWLTQLKSCAQLFARLEAAILKRDLGLYSAMNQSQRQYIRNARDTAAEHWRARFDCRALPSVHDRIVRDGVSVASNPIGTSSGGKHWFPIRGRFSKVTQAEELADKP